MPGNLPDRDRYAKKGPTRNAAEPIVYGFSGSADLIEDAKKGKIKLGGSVVNMGRADWRCSACGFEWYDINDPSVIKVIKMRYEMHKIAESQIRKMKKPIGKTRDELTVDRLVELLDKHR